MALIWLFLMIIVVMSIVLMTMNTKFSRFAGWLSLIAPVLSSIYFLSQIKTIYAGQSITYFQEWIPLVDVNLDLRLDGLSLIFALLISLIGAGVFLYAIYYLSHEKENLPRFYTYLLMFMLAMLGVVLSNNTILLYTFWELTSISSFLLISYWYQRRKSQDGALKSFLITVFGGMAMLVGLILLYSITGTNTITEQVGMIDKIYESPWFVLAVILILLGAFTKSAQFPFHIWLPDAMEAPTPVSAYLHSATMVKAGLYLLLRFTPIIGQSTWVVYTVVTIGLVTLLVGSFFAVNKKDLKAMLAYSTISQLGMIMTMIGLGLLALNSNFKADNEIFLASLFAALFHLINHAIFKSVLFMGVGIIDHETGTRDVKKLGGLRTIMPITAVVMTISALSMAGIPLFNGFLSKEKFFTSLVETGHTDIFNQTMSTMMILAGFVGSIFTFVYCIKLIKEPFFGKLKKEQLPKVPRHDGGGLLISPMIIVLFVPIIFFVPNVLGEYLIGPALRDIFHDSEIMAHLPHIKAWHGFTVELFLTLGIYIIGTLLILVPKWDVIYSKISKNLEINTLYTKGMDALDRISTFSIQGIMNNKLNQYLHIIYVIFFVIMGYGIYQVGIYDIAYYHITEATTFEIIILINIVITATALMFIRERMTMTILNGVIGYSIAVVFIFMKAPDLALTQLVIETITTVLFLLVFYHLPNVQKDTPNVISEIVKLTIALLMAVFVVVFVIMMQQDSLFDKISFYYDNAYELAGVKNIVNGILGDFRALDTMLEGIVILIAGLGIFTLVKFKIRKDEPNERK
ncbi:DUF4040 family protein [Mammaliicoccus sciuri]|uniref:DUF4040 family protein n=1 Tax=Mammaliicoccus sciuri TaxID=1296 RepID=UPI001E606DEF|nr:DUF4040 family protein [Mammaliicoccus sciuri]MCD8893757.1 DUF4040 family protein [Mammaliicoccus sciuri]MCD8911946.1 DUF4040 family protein [Mammaliicoccus sciuri]